MTDTEAPRSPEEESGSNLADVEREKLRRSISRLVENRLFQFEDDFRPNAQERYADRIATEMLLIIDGVLDGYKKELERAAP